MDILQTLLWTRYRHFFVYGHVMDTLQTLLWTRYRHFFVYGHVMDTLQTLFACLLTYNFVTC